MNMKLWLLCVLAGTAGAILALGLREASFRLQKSVLPPGNTIDESCLLAQAGETCGDVREEHGGENGIHSYCGPGMGLTMSLDEVLAVRCEHAVLAYRCDQCRYEIGVVAVPPEISGVAENERLVAFDVLKRRRLSSVHSFTGEVKFNELRTVRVSSPMPGILRALNVQPGEAVARDQVLFELESAEISQLLGEYFGNRTLTEIARKNYLREKDLHEKGISAEKEMLDAWIEYAQFEARLRTVRQQLAALGVDDAQIRNHDQEPDAPFRMAIRAPQEGVVVSVQRTAGQVTGPDEPVLILSDLDTLWVQTDLYERDVHRVWPRNLSGGQAAVRTAAYPDHVFQGVVGYLDNVMGETTRTVKLRVEVDNTNRLLRPGMFCSVELPAEPEDEVLAAPREAVLQDEGMTFLFAHLQDHYYVRRPVKTGRMFGDWIEILEGAAAGQTIVTQGAFLLKSDILREKLGAGCAD